MPYPGPEMSRAGQQDVETMTAALHSRPPPPLAHADRVPTVGTNEDKPPSAKPDATREGKQNEKQGTIRRKDVGRKGVVAVGRGKQTAVPGTAKNPQNGSPATLESAGISGGSAMQCL